MSCKRAGGRRLFTIDVVKKLPLDVLVLELAAEIGSAGFAVSVSDAAGRYAHVICIKHNTDIIRAKYALHLFADLNGETLLHLRPFCEILHNAIDL